MLSSPLQSLSPPPSNGSVPGVAQNPKTNTAVSDESPEISTRPSEVQAGPSQRPLQPTPEHEPDYLSTLTKGQKRTRTEVEGHEEEGLDQTSRTKRQRRELATLQPKQEPAPTTKSTKGPERKLSKSSRTKAMEGPKRNVLSPKAPLAQHTLSWKLRSRSLTSYRETDTTVTIENRRCQDKKKPFQRKSRLRRK